MKPHYQLGFLLFLTCSVNSCSTNIDIIADYEENAVVFAMIDPSQPIQYIKINKVFTNKNASAYSIANIPDSIYFDSLFPVITEIETGRTIPLYRTNVLFKDSGFFPSAPNYLYSTKEKLYASNPNNINEYYHYQLDMDLPKSGKHVTAQTDVPDSIILLLPASIASPNTRLLEFPYSGNIRVSFQAPYNSKIFDAYLFFNYLEINKQDTAIQTIRTIKFKLINNYRVVNYNTREAVGVTISSGAFYDFLTANIKEDATLKRRFIPCSVELTAANLEFDNFLQTTIPSIGIVQKQTEYSNVKGGFGLFASRRISRYQNVSIGPTTKSTIINFAQFKSLGFY